MADTPLRDAVAARIGGIREIADILAEPDECAADLVLAIVANHIAATVRTSTDARKKTILTGLADRIARGAL